MKKHYQIHNRPYLKPLRKALRNNGTAAEAVLWKALQKSQLYGRKFRRQHSIGDYITDFYCPREQLVIEVDGAVHDSPAAEAYDQERDAWLAELGFRVLRFRNEEVFENLDNVLHVIAAHFEEGNFEFPEEDGREEVL